VPAVTRAAITKYSTPSGEVSPAERVPIDLNTPTGQAILLALDAEGELRLAAVVSERTTQIGAASTAHALSRIALGGVELGNSIAVIDAAIRDAAHFAALTSAIESALHAERLSYADEAVVKELAAVTNAVIASLIPSGVALSKPAHPMVALPVEIVPDTLLGLFPIVVNRGAGAGASVSNKMPIPWHVKTTAGAGSLKEKVLRPGELDYFTGAAPGFSLIVSQTEETVVAAVVDIAVRAVIDLLPFAKADACDQETLKTALKLALESALRSRLGNTSNSIPNSISAALGEILRSDSVIKIAAKCVKEPYALLTTAANTLSAWSKVKAGFNTLMNIGKAAYAFNYASFGERGVSICQTSHGLIYSCATELQFHPSAVVMAPEARIRPDLIALDDEDRETLGFPEIQYTSSNLLSAEIDSTGTIIASSSLATGVALLAGPVTTEITALDTFTGAVGKLVVTLVIPQVRPASAIAFEGGSIELRLEDGGGKTPILPDGITWTVEPAIPSILVVGALCQITCPAGTQVFEAKAAGVVTVTARDSHGVAYSSATVTIAALPPAEPPPPDPDQSFVGSWRISYIDSIGLGTIVCGADSGVLTGQIVKAGTGYRLSVDGVQVPLSVGSGGESLSGSTSTSYPEDGGTTELEMSFSVTPGSLSGRSTWIWRGGDGYRTCSGTTQFSGSKTG
jgi:hypothetical protein